MAKGYKHGAGGPGLNFKVIGNPRPEIARENTIWLDTDNKITGWFFSSTEPAAPDEGMVWFLSGTSSTVQFNALKKNGIQVYPLAAKQYVSGAWVDVTAKSYQNGEWVEWTTYLFVNGNECVGLTGGWNGQLISAFSRGTINAAGNLFMSGGRKQHATVNAIAKGSFKTVCFEVVNVVQSSNPGSVIVLSNKVFDGSNPDALVRPTSAGTARLPLDAITSEFYVTVYSAGSSETLEISKVWLE